MLVDRYGRPLLKLRIVVNDVCNFTCVFCHFEGQRPMSGVLSPEDIGFAAMAFRKLGVGDFKITGGEPLLRRDIVDVVREIDRCGPDEISMTTNGYLLEKLSGPLAAAGLKRVNVSLHSLKRERYRRIMGVDALERVLRGIRAAMDSGLQVKINVVLLRENMDEIPDIIGFASKLGARVQIIELMPVNEGRSVFDRLYVDVGELVDALMSKQGARLVGTRRDLHNRPILEVDGVPVEIVKNWNNPTFCAACTTMRLTSDGKLKTCLYKDPAVDLYPAIRARDESLLIELIKRANSIREPNFKPIRLSNAL